MNLASIKSAIALGTFQGFDCILANPPYMRVQALVKKSPDEKGYYDSHYAVASGSYDLANLFIERAMQLSAPQGLNAFIFPHKFLNSASGQALRAFLLKNQAVSSIVNFGANQVFQGVTTYTCILNFGAQPSDAIDVKYFRYKEDYERNLTSGMLFNAVSYRSLADSALLYNKENNQWILFPTDIDESIFRRIYENSFPLGNAVLIYVGLQTSLDDVYIVEKTADGLWRVPLTGREYAFETNFMKPYVGGKEVHRYETLAPQSAVFFPYLIDQSNDKASVVKLDYLKAHCPVTYQYVMDHEAYFKMREGGKAAKMECWYAYIYPKSLTRHDSTRISTMEICSNHPNAALNSGVSHGSKVYSWQLQAENSYLNNSLLLGIANSRLLWWFLKLTGDTLSSDSRTMKTNYLAPFPLPKNPDMSVAAKIEELVHQRLACEDAQAGKSIEREIDEGICSLYRLSEDEKSLVMSVF